MLKLAHVKPKGHTHRDQATEILGFPYTGSLLRDIQNLDLLSMERKPADRVLVIQSNEGPDQRLLRNNLEITDVAVDFFHFPAPDIWAWIEDFGKVVVPYQIIQSVVSWICEAYP
jgi:hypothetical protein